MNRVPVTCGPDDVIEVTTVLVFKIAKTGKEVQIASDKGNIEALVEVMKLLSCEEGTGDVSEGFIFELGQASSELVRSDGSVIPGTAILSPHVTFPRIHTR